jgi:hypothetical protein
MAEYRLLAFTGKDRSYRITCLAFKTTNEIELAEANENNKQALLIQARKLFGRKISITNKSSEHPLLFSPQIP